MGPRRDPGLPVGLLVARMKHGIVLLDFALYFILSTVTVDKIAGGDSMHDEEKMTG